MDPDGYTVDFDRRNNQSGWMNHELLFRWPGMNYEPRNSYVIKWSPLLYYHELDGIIPGAYITRKYGPWEKTDITFNYALDSRKIYWSLRHWIKPVHFLPGISWDVLAYSQGGLNGQGIRLHGNWTQKYSVPPFHKWTLGFYRTNATDTSRTNLFDVGTVHAYFGKYKIHFHSNSIELETTVAPNGLSDWSFQRITATMNLSKNFGKFGIRNRVNIGKIWAGEDGVPSQERYTIEGAGSGDVFTNPFLRDESSFYGNINLRNHYHLSGDGNLRGYVNKGYAGSEKLIANSLECFYKKTIIGLNIELAGFIDAGVFWGSKWEQGDEMFDGTTLADAGIGIRMEKNWFGKDFYIRLDSPFWLNTIYGNENSVDYSRWIFSFSSGI